MALVSVDHAEPGMVLAAAVTDRQGRLLIPEGHELSERHVRALKTWGIAHVEIAGGDDASEQFGTADPESLSEATEALEDLFSRVDREHPFLDRLYDYCLNRKAHCVQRAREADDAA